MTDNVLQLGVDLAELLDDKDREAGLRWAVLASSYPITAVDVHEDLVTIRFENDAKLALRTGPQSCCERLYLSCDDDLASIAGGYLRSIQITDGPDVIDKYSDVHQQQFAKFRTTEGDFTIVSHNEHNGYYGGVSFDVSWLEPGEIDG